MSKIEAAALIGRETYKTELIARTHYSLADEMEKYGGTDLGPTAHEVLLESLGACTAITLRMYANRKEWPLDGVAVKVTLEKLGEVNTFDRKIELKGNLTEEQRARLLEIANHCPVHKILTGQIAINSQLT